MTCLFSDVYAGNCAHAAEMDILLACGNTTILPWLRAPIHAELFHELHLWKFFHTVFFPHNFIKNLCMNVWVSVCACQGWSVCVAVK